MRLIAIVGMTGSGKSEASVIFEKMGYQRIRFGDITDDILKEKGLELTEENERSVRENLRKDHGMSAYAKMNVPKVRETVSKKNVIIDGLYSWEEYVLLKQEFPFMVVLAVYAPPALRYERLVEREVRPLTYEQSRGRDKNEIENLNKAAPISMADYTIVNTGTLFDLKASTQKFLDWFDQKDEEPK